MVILNSPSESFHEQCQNVCMMKDIWTSLSALLQWVGTVPRIVLIYSPKTCMSRGAHAGPEIGILWAFTEDVSRQLPAEALSQPTFLTVECLGTDAPDSSALARLGSNRSYTSVNLSVASVPLAAQRKKPTGLESFLLELPGARKHGLLTGPARALLHIVLSGSVPIDDNFGKHCLNNSSQEKKKLLD